jgi:hypothetical protein
MQCPICAKAFQYGAAPPPPVIYAPPPPPAANSLAFDEPDGGRFQRRRAQSQVSGAAGSLVAGCVFAILYAVCNVSWFLYIMSTVPFFATRLMEILAVKIVLLLFLVVAPAIFIGVGSSALNRQWSYGFAMTGAILAVVLAVILLAFSVLMILDAMQVLDNSRFAWMGWTEICVVLIALLAVLFNLIGAIWTLVVLQHRDVVRAFKKNSSRRHDYDYELE